MTSMRRWDTNRSFVRWLRWNLIVRWVVLVPEAPLVATIALGAWVLHFPPLLGLLALIVVVWFFVRSAVLLVTEYSISHGNQRRAERLARIALLMHPWSVDALLLQAQVEIGRDRHEAAEALLQRAAHLDTPHGDVAAARVALHAMQGVTVPQPAPPVGSGAVSPALLHHYARVALHVEHDAAKAIDLLGRAAIPRLPASTGSPLLLLLAQAYIAQERYDEADATLQRCEAQLARCPRVQRAEALYHLGCLWQALGKDGTLYFRRSVELDHTGQFAHAAWRSAVTGK